MEAKSSEWRPGPTVCRCCLAEGCYKDISTEYFWMGKREVYAEMLAETFDLSIAYSKSGGPNSNSRLICEPCISRLRDAADFKRQVVECEKTFLHHLDPSASSAAAACLLTDLPGVDDREVKIERVKVERIGSDEEFDDAPNFDMDDDDDLDDQPLTTLASKVSQKSTSVDVLDLMDNAKVAEKRKSTVKVKASPAKKVKIKKDAKASASKAKPEKKKKGFQGQSGNETVVKVERHDDLRLNGVKEKRRYVRSARAEARILTKRNANTLLECWSICPFRWQRNRFKCAYCEDSFLHCSDLRRHVADCSSEHSVKDIYSKFKEMSLINVDVTDASCRLCKCPYSNISQMRQHAVQHGYHFDSSQPDGVLPFSLDKECWRCVICREVFNNFLKLYEHMNVHYQHYICPTCGKGYMTAPRLRKHSEVHITGSFPCDKCGRVFTMRAARDHHKAHAHAKGPRYECPHCNMRFNGYYDRMNHLNEAHREKEVSYRCTVCELSFKTSGKRAMHVRAVHLPQPRNFACTCCDWLFKTSYELKRHMVKHTGERNFCCTVCGKSYPRSRALRTHLKTHEELTCKWCGELFKQRAQMISHVRANHPDLNDLIAVETEKLTC